MNIDINKLIKIMKSKKVRLFIEEHWELDVKTYDEIYQSILQKNGFEDTDENIELCRLIRKGKIK